MDFGLDMVAIEGFVVGQNSGVLSHSSEVLDGKPECLGSGSIKQERSDPHEDEGNRATKMAKRVDDVGLRSNTENALPKEQMLSFSSSNKPEVSFLSGKDVGLISDKSTQNLAFSYYQQSAYSRTPSGLGSGNVNGGMHGSFTGIRGPFTPAQWIELEHQAMIYKYLIANIPVPANLLVPIRKALTSSGFPGFIRTYPSHSYGWGSFHLGFSGSTDPEPGRCRRTDGKKWRCSRDAVPDQKYCERHINRGRHRSRKPVEGHTGQAASGPTSTKGVPSMSVSTSAFITSSGGASSSVTIAQHQIKGLLPTGATNASADPIVNGYHDQQGLTVMPSTLNLKAKDSTFPIEKQNIPLDESSQSEFGFVSSDSLLNPSQKSSYWGSKSYNSVIDFSSQQTQDSYPLRHYTSNWPKDQSDCSASPWAEELKSDWTQLSMSIPMSSNFSSSSSSLTEEKISQPLRLSPELDPSQMGSRLGYVGGERGSTKQSSLNAVPWENPLGGPLGEVLNNASNVMGSCKAQNVKGKGWDGSLELGSSPTGVLQKSTFVSLSNSSSGGSPRGKYKKTQEGASLCDDLLISAAHATSSSIPSCKC